MPREAMLDAPETMPLWFAEGGDVAKVFRCHGISIK
jgi:hypothetical protein